MTQLILRLAASCPFLVLLCALPAQAVALPGGGNTPLHAAALRNDADTVDSLLAAKASADVTNDAGATPLHYAIRSARIVAALLAHGAKPDVISKAGITPLAGALHRADSFEVSRLLLAAGADVNGQHDGNVNEPTASLSIAIQGGDARTIDLLLAAGAKTDTETGFAPLSAAALVGNVDLVRRLLDLGADINRATGFAGSALGLAFYGQQPAVAALLIERGARLDMRSEMGHGTPPMVFSAYNQDGNSTTARLLLARGAALDVANDEGETALSFALKVGVDTELVRWLREHGAKEPPPARARRIPNHPVPDELAARTALARTRAQQAVALLQHNSTTFLDTGFVRQVKCISCHQQSLPAVAFGLARQRGLHLDSAALAQQLRAQLAMWGPRAESALQLSDPVPDSPVSLGFGADGLAALDYPADGITDAMSHYLLAVQQKDGHWASSDRRPPMEDGPVISTAWAARMLQLYPPRGQEQETTAALRTARTWLAAQTGSTTNDRVFQLLGCAWAGAEAALLQPFVQQLLATQREDGGFAQLPTLGSDAWATGSALVALHKAGVAVTDAAFQRGIGFLLRTQYDDGSWWVKSRTWPFQPHFDGHFPHGKDQWISAAGTAWATMALLLLLEPTADASAQLDAKALLAVPEPTPTYPASSPAPVVAAAVPGAGAAAKVDFARDIRPLLQRSCVDCHTGDKVKGDLNLGSRATMLKGGQSGDPAVVPGRSQDSHLLRYVQDRVEDLEMPPLKRRGKYPALTAAEVEMLRAWIDAGAVWEQDK